MAEKFKPEYIYADAEEKYVKAVVLYNNGGNLYFDKNKEHAVNGADVLNFFLKGLIVVDPSGSYFTAIGYKVENECAVISYYEDSELLSVIAEIETE